MTAASHAIETLISYSFTDWAVTLSEEVAVLGVLRTDSNMPATIRDLHAAGMILPLVERIDENDHPRILAELLGGGSDASSAPVAQVAISIYRANLLSYFTLSYELQNGLRRLGASFAATPFNSVPYAGLIPGTAGPFTGVGATGTNPASLSVPWRDQALLAAGHDATESRYSNPIPGNLMMYLSGLAPNERKQQAELLLGQPISSVVPYSYRANLPSRADVIRLAANAHNLEGALVAAFILAEQRDQTQLEDAKDYTAATSLFKADTSIGLGQVVVSTARRGDLFSDLLSSGYRKSLSHTAISTLLASDEFNIFAVAKYIRATANSGAGKSIAALPATQAKFPGINLPRFAAHSSAWPDDNIRALGSEYTSKPWDDRLSPGWGDFVLEAYRDVKASGAI